jgi:hypothetical protein
MSQPQVPHIDGRHRHCAASKVSGWMACKSEIPLPIQRARGEDTSIITDEIDRIARTMVHILEGKNASQPKATGTDFHGRTTLAASDSPVCLGVFGAAYSSQHPIRLLRSGNEGIPGVGPFQTNDECRILAEDDITILRRRYEFWECIGTEKVPPIA